MMLVRPKQSLWRMWVFAVLLGCFGTLTLLEPVIHAHELDPVHVEEDCAACNWSQNFVGADLGVPAVSTSTVVPEDLVFHTYLYAGFPRYSISSRSPPVLR